MESTKLRVLFCVGPKGPSKTQSLIDMVKDRVAAHVEGYDFVQDQGQYDALADKYSYDIVVVQLGTTISGPVLKDQTVNSKRFKWVHSLSAGIDGYVAVQEFRDSEIPLTNAKGAFDVILGEFVALGVLFHTKHV